MVGEDGEIETGERDATSHGTKLFGGESEGFFKCGLGGDIAREILECVAVGEVGRADIETGDSRLSCKESFDGRGTNETCTSSDQNVSSFEVEREVHFYGASIVHWFEPAYL